MDKLAGSSLGGASMPLISSKTRRATCPSYVNVIWLANVSGDISHIDKHILK
ncbi:hypothetical protein [Moraxella catarrhalis]|uniref:hypothetical protein n=1 Tax=Moraxella catarrhalis TaxID=480 RepID=UPI001D106063|nr:hypothetical protein [Moraxella catarrhalis]